MKYLGYMGNWTDAQGNTRQDSELREYTRQFLRDYYNLVPVPGYPTVGELSNAIVGFFMSKVEDEDNKIPPVSFYGQSGSADLDRTVRSLSPLSRLKPGIVFVQTRLPEPQYRPPAVPEPITLTLPRLIPASYTPPPRASSWTDAEGRSRPDSELESYAWSYLRNNYILRPVGSETLSQLQERIMYAFLRHQGVTSSGATFDSEIGPITMDEVVRAVSPLSVPKPKPVASTDTQIAIRTQGVVPALTKPAPGKVPVKLDWTQLFALVESGMVGYANAQKQQAAAQLMAIQQSGQPLYVDYRTADNIKKKDNTLMYVGLGIAALGGLFLLLRD